MATISYRINKQKRVITVKVNGDTVLLPYSDIRGNDVYWLTECPDIYVGSLFDNEVKYIPTKSIVGHYLTGKLWEKLAYMGYECRLQGSLIKFPLMGLDSVTISCFVDNGLFNVWVLCQEDYSTYDENSIIERLAHYGVKPIHGLLASEGVNEVVTGDNGERSGQVITPTISPNAPNLGDLTTNGDLCPNDEFGANLGDFSVKDTPLVATDNLADLIDELPIMATKQFGNFGHNCNCANKLHIVANCTRYCIACKCPIPTGTKSTLCNNQKPIKAVDTIMATNDYLINGLNSLYQFDLLADLKVCLEMDITASNMLDLCPVVSY